MKTSSEFDVYLHTKCFKNFWYYYFFSQYLTLLNYLSGWTEDACQEWTDCYSHIKYSELVSVLGKSLCVNWEQVFGCNCINVGLLSRPVVWTDPLVYIPCYEKSKPVSLSHWKEKDATSGKSSNCFKTSRLVISCDKNLVFPLCP